MTDKSAAVQIMAKSWDELEALEHPVTGHLLFPWKLKRRKVKGQVEERDVMLRIPRQPDLRAARKQARDLFEKEGLKLPDDQTFFDDLEVTCTLQVAIRNNTEPYEPLEISVDALEKNWDRPSLVAAYEYLNTLVALTDPRDSEISPDEMLAVIAGISSSRSIRPLLGYGSASQSHCIISMADMVMTSLASKSSSEPSGS